MKTVAVATHKGGAGKTVTAMALAAALARTGSRVLLVDLDPQGHSTLGLGVEADMTISDALHAGPAGTATVYLAGARLDLIAADIRLERIQHLLFTRPRREQFLVGLLRPFRGSYDACLIDCPPSLGVLTEGAVAAADFILVPCQMEARATDGLVDLLELVEVLKGEAFDRWAIVRTRVDERKSKTNAAINAALRPWEAHVLDATIPQSEPLNQAQIARQDIFTFAPACTGAVAYAALAETLRALLPLEPVAVAS